MMMEQGKGPLRHKTFHAEQAGSSIQDGRVVQANSPGDRSGSPGIRKEPSP